MQVYKFLGANFALEDLRKRRLKISTYDDMNDPFELSGVSLSDPTVQVMLSSHFRSSHGALCFSRAWSNPILWSHYGDKHRGNCLGFDIIAAVEIQEPLYVENMSVLDSDALVAATTGGGSFTTSEHLIKRMLLTKFEGWRYEDEVRILIRLNNEQKEGGLYFAEFDESIQPNMLVCGARCSVGEGAIEEAISGYSPPMRLVQAILSPNSFDIIEERRADAPDGSHQA